jgi:hypothetical protein
MNTLKTIGFVILCLLATVGAITIFFFVACIVAMSTMK